MKLKQDKHYINTIYYKIEQTAKYCRYLGNQVFQKLNLPITLDEFATLDTIKIYGEICQRDLAKLIFLSFSFISYISLNVFLFNSSSLRFKFSSTSSLFIAV